MTPSPVPAATRRGIIASRAGGPRRSSRRRRLSLWSYRITRWALALVFIGAGIAKLAKPGDFAVIVDSFGLLPPPLVGVAALGLPALELAAGAGLAFEIRGSLSMITALTLLFIAILGYGLYMGLDVDCGCFGPQEPEAEAFHSLRTAFYRDVVLLAAIAYLFAWRAVRKSAHINVAN